MPVGYLDALLPLEMFGEDAGAQLLKTQALKSLSAQQAARSIPRAALKASTLEGTQEVTQQVLQNAIANMYEDRPLMEGAGESFLAGALLGGPVGAAHRYSSNRAEDAQLQQALLGQDMIP